MRFEVLLTGNAEHDLEGIYDYIAASDSQRNAGSVLDRLLERAVVIYVIADGRRDMQTLLSHRLLGG